MLTSYGKYSMKSPFSQGQSFHAKNTAQARPAHELQAEKVMYNCHLQSSNVLNSEVLGW